MGLPEDVVNLVEVWLLDCSYNATVDGVGSYVVDHTHGTVQVSILGPTFAIYVSPLFYLTDITNFANDDFAIDWIDTIPELIETMQKKLETIIKRLKDTGLIINDSKTELCQFQRNDDHPVTLNLSGQVINSKKLLFGPGSCVSLVKCCSEHLMSYE